MPLDPDRHPHLSPDLLAEADAGAVTTRVLPPMEVAYTLHVGPYATLGDAFERLIRWTAEQGFELAGPPGNRYLDDPDVTPETELITEVFCPIRRVARPSQ